MPAGPARVPRVYVQTLGCPKNEADSRAVARSVASAGCEVVADPIEATHILLNTCGFVQEAKEESIGAILEACALHPDKQVLVMGCLVERYRHELASGIPEVAGWYGVAGGVDQTGLLQALQQDQSRRAPVAGRGVRGASAFEYLKVSDGCDELCSFCAIPGIKGPYHAASLEEVLREADACLAGGARELVLVGQDTAIWRGGELGLTDLVDLLAADARVEWLRTMYLQPDHVSDALLECMASQPKLCRYLDLPFQHSHPEVLRRMGRAGDGESYLRLLARAGEAVPDVALRSAFIVGFPGETESHFEHLLEFVSEAEFDYAGGFIYSPEEGTAAARLRPRVPRRVALERLNRLSQALLEASGRKHARQVGSTAEVMIDSLGDDASDEPGAIGRTRGQAPEVDGAVHVEGELPPGTQVGDVITVTIEAAVGYDFVGRPCGA
jgi:ribosomal protein S12 methylthiotransferase